MPDGNDLIPGGNLDHVNKINTLSNFLGHGAESGSKGLVAASLLQD